MTLKEWIDKNGKTISEVAEGADVQAASLSRFIRGEAGLSLKSAKSIVEYVAAQNAANGWRGGVGYEDLVLTQAEAKP